MVSQRAIEVWVGLFMLLGTIAFCVLALKVSGLTSFFPGDTYTITAEFDDIGGLKVRSPVKVGGVPIGQVSAITLNETTFKAVVWMRIYSAFSEIPEDSSASILTSGLLGDNYISITPMYSKTYLKQGSHLQFTTSAMVLEKLIGQFIYKLGGSSDAKATHAH